MKRNAVIIAPVAIATGCAMASLDDVTKAVNEHSVAANASHSLTMAAVDDLSVAANTSYTQTQAEIAALRSQVLTAQADVAAANSRTLALEGQVAALASRVGTGAAANPAGYDPFNTANQALATAELQGQVAALTSRVGVNTTAVGSLQAAVASVDSAGYVAGIASNVTALRRVRADLASIDSDTYAAGIAGSTAAIQSLQATVATVDTSRYVQHDDVAALVSASLPAPQAAAIDTAVLTSMVNTAIAQYLRDNPPTATAAPIDSGALSAAAGTAVSDYVARNPLPAAPAGATTAVVDTQVLVDAIGRELPAAITSALADYVRTNDPRLAAGTTASVSSSTPASSGVAPAPSGVSMSPMVAPAPLYSANGATIAAVDTRGVTSVAQLREVYGTSLRQVRELRVAGAITPDVAGELQGRLSQLYRSDEAALTGRRK